MRAVNRSAGGRLLLGEPDFEAQVITQPIVPIGRACIGFRSAYEGRPHRFAVGHHDNALGRRPTAPVPVFGGDQGIGRRVMEIQAVADADRGFVVK